MRGVRGSAPQASCSHCQKQFNTSPYKLLQPRIYCSWECKKKGLERTHTEPCHQCGADVTRRRSAFRRGGADRVFCGRSCSSQWRAENPSAERLANYGKQANVFRNRYDDACFLCGFDRVVEFCHLIAAKDLGTVHPDNIVTLCPNHHTLFDKGLLTSDEMEKLAPLKTRADSSPYSRRFIRRRRDAKP